MSSPLYDESKLHKTLTAWSHFSGSSNAISFAPENEIVPKLYTSIIYFQELIGITIGLIDYR